MLDSNSNRNTAEVIEQRNFSRIFTATHPEWGSVFTKEFIDRRGTRRADLFEAEQVGMRLMKQALLPLTKVTVPQPIVSDSSVPRLQYRRLPLVPLDELLRRGPEEFARTWPTVCETVADIVRCLASVRLDDVDGALLKAKRRPYSRGSMALCFKGIDVRNLAIHEGTGEIVIFDAGLPYWSCVDEVAAKFFTSALLLNWGKPLRRTLRGPESASVQAMATTLRPWLHRQAAEADVLRERALRIRDPQAVTDLRGVFKSGGTRVLSSRYTRQSLRLLQQCVPLTERGASRR